MPGHGEGAAPPDVDWKSWVEERKRWGEDTPVGLGEEDGDSTTEGRELISVGLGELPNQSLAFQAAEVVGGLSRGIACVE